ncbi:MAG TPA: Clp protease N-terminal domain-containing protein [Chthoniobacter sp.]|nr:Clp protease N-terminal domain-containing protein [Chthoniobacter sp.]
MLTKFTPRVQRVLELAQEEARRLRHNFVGTEHLLAAFTLLGEGIAVTALQKSGIDLAEMRIEVEKLVGYGPEGLVVTKPPYTPRVKKVLALANRQAKLLGHNYVGTEHLLLGLLKEHTGVGAEILKKHGLDYTRARREIFLVLGQEDKAPQDDGGLSGRRGCLFLWCWWL